MNTPFHAIIFLMAMTVSPRTEADQLQPLVPVPIQKVVKEDDCWTPKLKVCREVTIPDCYAKSEKEGALTNFDKIRDDSGGEHGGPPWYDGLIDKAIPRFTCWDHRGTKEWVQYDFDRPTKVFAVEAYWWDERRIDAHCRVPQSWRLLRWAGGEWKSVTGATAFGVEMDRFNRVTFDPVETTAVRLEVHLQPGGSGGILEWKVE